MRVIQASNIEMRQIGNGDEFQQISEIFNAMRAIPVDEFIANLDYDSRINNGFNCLICEED